MTTKANPLVGESGGWRDPIPLERTAALRHHEERIKKLGELFADTDRLKQLMDMARAEGKTLAELAAKEVDNKIKMDGKS